MYQTVAWMDFAASDWAYISLRKLATVSARSALSKASRLARRIVGWADIARAAHDAASEPQGPIQRREGRCMLRADSCDARRSRRA